MQVESVTVGYFLVSYLLKWISQALLARLVMIMIFSSS